MLTRISLTALAVVACAATASQAQTIYSYPFGPFHGDTPEAEMANDAHPIIRFLAMCEAFGLECSVPDIETAQAEAEERLDDFLEAWDDYLTELAPDIGRPLPFPFGGILDGSDNMAQIFGGHPFAANPFYRNPFAGPQAPAMPFNSTPFGQQDLPVLPRIEIPENGLPELPRPSLPAFPWIPL